eukprot:UN03886
MINPRVAPLVTVRRHASVNSARTLDRPFSLESSAATPSLTNYFPGFTDNSSRGRVLSRHWTTGASVKFPFNRSSHGGSALQSTHDW